MEKVEFLDIEFGHGFILAEDKEEAECIRDQWRGEYLEEEAWENCWKDQYTCINFEIGSEWWHAGNRICFTRNCSNEDVKRMFMRSVEIGINKILEKRTFGVISNGTRNNKHTDKRSAA